MKLVTKIDIDGWTWSTNPSELTVLHDLRDSKGELLAWVEKRHSYCDRGHWKGNIEIACGLNDQDGWPNYYMSLDRAQKEISAFLKWRLFKVRYVE